ncbi:hypothetical protein OH76DRAFT_78038 [Lentinus brumalis]|uniref:Uncharacterized protein n=1 Tax=Lentinus brumalis TaxID=2498619 RepID=A0A371DKV4_9APHY|nr:hypothetical protein OH76DRAFT_78038 [Polyporus brumalis]
MCEPPPSSGCPPACPTGRPNVPSPYHPTYNPPPTLAADWQGPKSAPDALRLEAIGPAGRAKPCRVHNTCLALGAHVRPSGRAFLGQRKRLVRRFVLQHMSLNPRSCGTSPWMSCMLWSGPAQQREASASHAIRHCSWGRGCTCAERSPRCVYRFASPPTPITHRGTTAAQGRT